MWRLSRHDRGQQAGGIKLIEERFHRCHVEGVVREAPQDLTPSLRRAVKQAIRGYHQPLSVPPGSHTYQRSQQLAGLGVEQIRVSIFAKRGQQTFAGIKAESS